MHKDAVRAIELSAERIVGFQMAAFLTGSGNHLGRAGLRIEFTDQMVLGVGDDHVVAPIHAEVLWPVQLAFEAAL